ncbi:hypothetical protein EQM14_00870 [Caproiciproducens sp. NJN-50]|uniref:DsrE family protein n=1 Tax=Acutalibacteraceae TaxID=3082771 RepID=UPI000FFE1B3D|nr:MULTISPECIES: DsrE family protein [Acutalibacteraceae]QAT48448.1 hypothetical protein EQM14_00870 [Caproiciproducens sp. NJN-50]
MPKVIFHVDESGRWPMVLSNAESMMKYARAEHVLFEIEILANSEAVRQLTAQAAAQAELTERMEELARSGVRFAGCRNAMRGLNIEPGDLLPLAQTVPSGVVELALRQEEGYAYIRP